MKVATLGYIRRNGKTLMLHRVKKLNDIHEGKWNGVGGKLEEGETPVEGMIREAQEETGLNVKNPQLKVLLTFPDFLNGETWHVFVFLINEFDGEVCDNCNEGNLEWIANEDVLQLNLWGGDKYFIPCLDQEGLFSGKFYYQNGELQDYQIERIG